MSCVRPVSSHVNLSIENSLSFVATPFASRRVRNLRSWSVRYIRRLTLSERFCARCAQMNLPMMYVTSSNHHINLLLFHNCVTCSDWLCRIDHIQCVFIALLQFLEACYSFYIGTTVSNNLTKFLMASEVPVMPVAPRRVLWAINDNSLSKSLRGSLTELKVSFSMGVTLSWVPSCSCCRATRSTFLRFSRWRHQVGRSRPLQDYR